MDVELARIVPEPNRIGHSAHATTARDLETAGCALSNRDDRADANSLAPTRSVATAAGTESV
jgi:hypothetical protein